MVSSGGTLIYCTCSLQPEEGPKQIASLLADRAPVQRLPIAAAEVGGLVELITADGDLRTDRYPNFARLAADSTFFRNAVTVEQQTEHSVPASVKR